MIGISHFWKWLKHMLDNVANTEVREAMLKVVEDVRQYVADTKKLVSEIENPVLREWVKRELREL